MTVEPAEGTNTQIKSYFNYLNRENYFLKASGKTKSKAYGANCVGCTFKIMKTELNGDRHPEIRRSTFNDRNTRVWTISYKT